MSHTEPIGFASTWMPGRFGSVRASMRPGVAALRGLPYLDGHLRQAPGEARLRLRADRLHHGRAQVDADVGRLVGGEDARLRDADAPLGDLLAVHEQRALATLGRAATVVREIEDHRV